MVEAVCFETDHRYVRSTHHEGYVCLKCRAFISLAEFEKRANTRLQADGLTPLAHCGICDTWHTPAFGVGTQKAIPLQASQFAEVSPATIGGR